MALGAHIILMGLRGSGKSTLGRRLAEAHGWDFIDLDDRTRTLLGCATVAEAFEARGEPAFRAAEVQALRAVLAHAPRVIALGGGTPTAPGAQLLLREAIDAGAALIYLRASADTLRVRLTDGDPNRPSLTGAGPLVEIEEVLGARDATYRDLATAVIETDGMDEAAVLQRLEQLAPP
ncbi:MAG: shikimate kinase [Phycisphaerales bacterium JB039]